MLIDCIFDHYEKERVKALIRYQMFYFSAISSRDMSTSVGIIPQFSYNLSLISHISSILMKILI